MPAATSASSRDHESLRLATRPSSIHSTSHARISVGTPLDPPIQIPPRHGRESRLGRPMATWKDVSRLALALPDAEEGATGHGGHRGWTVRKKLFVWERPLRKTDLA